MTNGKTHGLRLVKAGAGVEVPAPRPMVVAPVARVSDWVKEFKMIAASRNPRRDFERLFKEAA